MEASLCSQVQIGDLAILICLHLHGLLLKALQLPCRGSWRHSAPPCLHADEQLTCVCGLMLKGLQLACCDLRQHIDEHQHVCIDRC